MRTADATLVCYKDRRSGAPVVFSHGWLLSSDAWEEQMFYLASHGLATTHRDRLNEDLLEFLRHSVDAASNIEAHL